MPIGIDTRAGWLIGALSLTALATVWSSQEDQPPSNVELPAAAPKVPFRGAFPAAPIPLRVSPGAPGQAREADRAAEVNVPVRIRDVHGNTAPPVGETVEELAAALELSEEGIAVMLGNYNITLPVPPSGFKPLAQRLLDVTKSPSEVAFYSGNRRLLIYLPQDKAEELQRNDVSNRIVQVVLEALQVTKPAAPVPRVIVVEASPDIERSELVRKVVEALEKEGDVKREDVNRVGQPVDFTVQLSVRQDAPEEKVHAIIDSLMGLGISKFTFSASGDDSNRAIVTTPADATWRRVRDIEEALKRHPDFVSDVRVAANRNPVIPTVSPALPIAEAGAASPRQRSQVVAYRLQQAKASSVAKIIEQLLVRRAPAGTESRIAVDERTNSVLVVGSEPFHREVKELVTLLDEIQTREPAGGDAAPAASPAGNSADADEHASDLRRRFQQLEQRAQTLVKQSREPGADAAHLTLELQAVVRQAFETRQELQRAELAEFARRLKDLEESIEMRDRVSSQIVARRVEELLDGNVKWIETPSDALPWPAPRQSPSPSMPRR